jgi:hypothetical protein
MTEQTERETGREVAYQVCVVERTFVGTEGVGPTRVSEIDMVPKSADVIHPDVAEWIEDEFGVEYPRKYDPHVADECDIDGRW